MLLYALDHLEWDTRSVTDVAASVDGMRPLWLRIANFMGRSLCLLRALARPQLVMWKLEFWGTDAPFDRVPATPGVDPAAYAAELLSMGHRVVPYTFNEWNRARLLDVAPALRQRRVLLLPIAQKSVTPGASRAEIRARFNLPRDSLVVGAGGLFHPAKGIEEIVSGFLRTFPHPAAHLLCSLVVEDEDTPETIRAGWSQSLGDVDMDRVHVRVGGYGDWPWMCSFYRSIDLLMVNSVSDSWGRMVSEALGAGIPTLVRRADCGTNHIATGLVLVDGFTDMASDVFESATDEARRQAPQLAAYVGNRYSVPVVRRLWLDALRALTPVERRTEFARAAADPVALAALDEALVY